MNIAGRAVSALIFAACSLSPARSADAIDSVTMSGVQVFLEAYQTLSQARSPVFYELYSDRALVLTEVSGRAPMRFLGMNYKAWGKDLLSRAMAFPDASRFEAPQIERHGAHLHVLARRYSLGRCYLDQGYSLTLEPFRNGYQIIEEHLALQPAARCEPEILAGPAPAVVRGFAPALPHATWHPMSADEINATALRLAQQMPRPAEPQRSPRPAPTSEAVPPASNPSDLWVTPLERP